MSERSVTADEHYREASQQFEYFVLGVTGTLCAYISQNLKAHKLDWSPYTLEVISLLLLIGSVVVGFRRLEKLVLSHKLNSRLLDLSERRGQFVSNLTSHLNVLSGIVCSPDEITQHVAKIDKALPELQKQMDTAVASATSLYKNRNWLLGWVSSG